MSLDIRFIQRKKRNCPHCGKEIAAPYEIDTVDSGGRVWYPFLESIGYYVPYEERTEENDWYGKDMVLTIDQAKQAYQFVKEHDVYAGKTIAMIISCALMEEDDIVVNADW